MPVKPWALGPKKSLNIFGGLGEVLDARAERQQTLEDRLALQDARRQQAEARTLEMKIKEAELAAMSRPPKRKALGTKEATDGTVYTIFDDNTAEPVSLGGGAPPAAVGHSNDNIEHGAPGIPQQQVQTPQPLRLGVKPEKKPDPYGGRTREQWLADEKARADATYHPPQVKPEKTGIDALPPAQQNQVKIQQTSILNLDAALKALDDAVAKHGLEVLPGEGKAAMDALSKEAQIQYKEAANLGVLNGPDLTLIEGALGNATSPTQFLRGGAKGVRASLKAARQALKSRARTMESVYGTTMPAEFYADATQSVPSAAVRPDSTTRPVAPIASVQDAAAYLAQQRQRTQQRGNRPPKR